MVLRRHVEEARPPRVALAPAVAVRTHERNLGGTVELRVVLIVHAVQDFLEGFRAVQHVKPVRARLHRDVTNPGLGIAKRHPLKVYNVADSMRAQHVRQVRAREASAIRTVRLHEHLYHHFVGILVAPLRQELAGKTLHLCPPRWGGGTALQLHGERTGKVRPALPHARRSRGELLPPRLHAAAQQHACGHRQHQERRRNQRPSGRAKARRRGRRGVPHARPARLLLHQRTCLLKPVFFFRCGWQGNRQDHEHLSTGWRRGQRHWRRRRRQRRAWRRPPCRMQRSGTRCRTLSAPRERCAARSAAGKNRTCWSAVARSARGSGGTPPEPVAGRLGRRPGMPAFRTTDAARAGQALERDASLSIRASVAGSSAKALPEVGVSEQSHRSTGACSSLLAATGCMGHASCPTGRGHRACACWVSPTRSHATWRVQTRAGAQGQGLEGVFPQSVAGRGWHEPAQGGETLRTLVSRLCARAHIRSLPAPLRDPCPRVCCRCTHLHFLRAHRARCQIARIYTHTQTHTHTHTHTHIGAQGQVSDCAHPQQPAWPRERQRHRRRQC